MNTALEPTRASRSRYWWKARGAAETARTPFGFTVTTPPIMRSSSLLSGRTSRRSFLKASSTLAGVAPAWVSSLAAQSGPAIKPLIAYVGTFSSPLRDVLPTQVDLPPGNGRGIHLFDVDRATGALSPCGVHEMGTSPSCLALNAAGTRLYSANETDRVGDDERRVGQRVRHRSSRRQVETAQHRPLRRRRSDVRQRASVRDGSCWSPTILAAPWRCCRFCPTAAWAPRPTSRTMPARLARQRRRNAPPGSFAISGHDRTHAHMIEADPAGRFVLHADLGLDQIFVWKFDDRAGTADAERSPRRRAAAGRRTAAFCLSSEWPLVLFHSGGRLDRRPASTTTRQRPPDLAADHLHPAARVRRQQLLLRDPGLRRWPLCLCRQPPARQHRDLLCRRNGRA